MVTTVSEFAKLAKTVLRKKLHCLIFELSTNCHFYVQDNIQKKIRAKFESSPKAKLKFLKCKSYAGLNFDIFFLKIVRKNETQCQV